MCWREKRKRWWDGKDEVGTGGSTAVRETAKALPNITTLVSGVVGHVASGLT